LFIYSKVNLHKAISSPESPSNVSPADVQYSQTCLSDPLYITTSFVSRPNLFLPSVFPCIRPLIWKIYYYELWEWDVVSRSCKYQLEGYWQQSLHQLGKTDIFPKSGLCMFIYYLTSGLIIILINTCQFLFAPCQRRYSQTCLSDPLYITISFVSRPYLFLPSDFLCIQPLYNDILATSWEIFPLKITYKRHFMLLSGINTKII
jgi:hypothetical protein